MVRSLALIPRLFALLLVAGGIFLPECRAEGPAARPNLLLIVADDLGYGDLSIHGCKDISTPHIDSIAREGVRCSDGYVSAPQCSPTRAGLLTGRYQQRFGHEFNSAVPGSALALSETTLADRLRAAGYVTGLVGKWHLGTDDAHHPLKRGFQEFFGFLGGANPYLPQGPAGEVPRILRGREPAHETSYLTDAFAREAVAFIDRHQKESFFLYLAFNAPHGPLQAKEESLKRFATIADETRRTYAAMVSALDEAVGAVLGKLRAAGLDDQTLVVFLSDNGGPTDVNASRNTPWRGVKGEVREGGIRVPFFLRWKGRLPAGTVYQQPVIQLDLLPTALAAAGVPLPAEPPLDGVNLLPYLDGQKAEAPHDVLYWRFNFPPRQPSRYKWAIRQGRWKLFTDIDANRQKRNRSDRADARMLVDLTTDIHESTDLSQQYPEKFQALEAAWKMWNAEMAEPGENRAASRRDRDNTR
ncbi:MAG: sulfatase-like hydrolase/transferase [Isosphaeraceae bacterium]|nr:sulfatase-like hydrolase/transferase [Isosphaeraceae bacterium]